jgi:hypothetical protein
MDGQDWNKVGLMQEVFDVSASNLNKSNKFNSYIGQHFLVVKFSIGVIDDL